MKLTDRQTKLINDIFLEDADRIARGRRPVREDVGAEDAEGPMKIRLGELRRMIHEAYYNLDINKVKQQWPNEIEDAMEFVMCHMNIDKDAAYGHVVNNWVFDTLEHDGETVLLARDEATNDALAYTDKMGGWYYRIADNKEKCRQVGSQRGYEQKKSSIRDKETVRPPAKSGTAVSGQRSQRMKDLEKAMYSGHDI